MSKKTSNQKRSFIISGAVIAVITVIVIAALAISSNKQSEVALAYEQGEAISTARMVSLMNEARDLVPDADDKPSELDSDSCEILARLAAEAGSDFLDCTYHLNLYIATPDTNTTEVTTLSDDTHTATFTTDNDRQKLLDYSFEQGTAGGYDSFGLSR